ncbi:MAG: FkbM family methyltransferase [Chthoniobacterales bacterium]|nr:FkbM family methyltransferase [Chthoniobacterales bacterium]
MKSFEDTVSSRFLSVGKRILTRPVRLALLRVPFLPSSVARMLDDIRFVEPDVLRFVGNTVRRGWCCVDVGAHCGTVSLRMAKLVSASGLVIAVEPIPENADLLERNLRSEGLLSRCVVVRAAAGAEESRSVMLRGEHSTTWRIVAPDEVDGKTERVDVRCLDEICRPHRAPDFVKVDIEGGEVELMAGAREVLSASRPVWLFEMHFPKSWRLVPEFLSLGYRAFFLDGSEIPNPVPGNLRYGHVVFCPQEKIGLLG